MKQIMLSKRAVPMGMMCMVFATLGNYQFFISEACARNKEHESLAHLAYADGLTGIPNRSRLEKFINTIEERGEDYCIVSIDLNELKPVNDKQGHLMGDKYLLEFSDILQSCFTGKGFIARIGGDEFVAVLRDTNILLAEDLMNEVNTKLEKLNKKDSSINRSAAFGFAFRHEVENQGWNAVYLLADERMYKKKTAMKGLK
jgi:diguanylate cyclase (GGDEF)-like protein